MCSDISWRVVKKQMFKALQFQISIESELIACGFTINVTLILCHIQDLKFYNLNTCGNERVPSHLFFLNSWKQTNSLNSLWKERAVKRLLRGHVRGLHVLLFCFIPFSIFLLFPFFQPHGGGHSHCGNWDF